MKNSEIYHKAALAVMNDTLLGFTFEERLQVIELLLEDERLAKFTENREAEEAAV